MQPEVDHIQITVREFHTAIAFYDKLIPLLGFTLRNRTVARIEEHDLEVVEYNHARLTIALSSPRKQESAEQVLRRRPGALHHLAFRAASRRGVDELYEQVRAIGATIVAPPLEYPEYTSPGYYAFFFKDPDGLKYEIVHHSGVA